MEERMSESEPLLLGTRGSELALTQARMVEAALAEVDIACRIEVIRTTGDKRPDLRLSEFSQGENPVLDKGIFTRELEEALASGRIDFAVHSLKDVPTELEEGFAIAATLPRAPVEDVLLSREAGLGEDLGALAGRTLATSSVRRARQLRWLCPELEVVDIRGNVPTRIGKLLAKEDWDGILLARAGLERLGILPSSETRFAFEGATVHARVLPEEEFLPAAGQGAVAMECLAENGRALAALEKINHRPTFVRIRAEREFLRLLGAGCQTPVGARTWFEEEGAVLGMAVRVFDESEPDAGPGEAVVRGEAVRPEEVAAMAMRELG